MQYTSPTFRPLDFTSFSLSVSPFSLLLSRFPHRADLPLYLPLSFYLVILWSVHDIHFVRISRGGFQARKPPPSRGSMSGKRETSNGLALSSPPSSASAYPTSLSLFLHLFSSVSICISFSLIVYPSPFFLPLYLFLSLSLLFLLPFSQPAYPLKGGGPGDETDPTRISGAIEANRGRMSNAALSTSLVRVLLVGSIFFSLPRDPKARTRRSAIGERNKCDNSRNSAFIYTASAVRSDPMDLSPFVR